MKSATKVRIAIITAVLMAFTTGCKKETGEISENGSSEMRSSYDFPTVVTVDGEKKSGGSICRDTKEDKQRLLIIRKMINELINTSEKEKRVSTYSSWIGNLTEERSKTSNLNLRTLFESIAIAEEAEAIESFEKLLLEKAKKIVLWRSVSRCCERDKRPLLVKWAMENPDDVWLMQYHPNGLDMLFRTLENRDMPSNKRVLSVRLIAEIGDESSIDRLERFRDDPTLVDLINAQALKKVKTLGEVVVESIERLRLKR